MLHLLRQIVRTGIKTEAPPAPATERADVARLTQQLAHAFEELIAEINAAFCCASLGIAPTVRHADYIGSWLD